MNIYAWIVVGFFLFGLLTNILLIGKPREPLTPGMVAVSALLQFGLVTLVYLAATR